MSVTMRDVARLAGVSVATVSRVLNASAVVQTDTRDRVLAVARDLRFAPNGAARSLITQRTHALGVILPDLHGEFFSELLRGMDRTAQRHGHHLLVSSSHHEPEGLAIAVRAMRGHVDGLLVMAPDIPLATLVELLPGGSPTVLLNCGELPAGVHPDVRVIGVDNHGGARAMTRHLLALGHRRIGFIAGAAHNFDAAERERGHRDELAAAGLAPDDRLHVRGAFTESGGWRAATTLMKLAEPPSAIFCANDAMAIGALSALRGAAITVPDEVAVVGFDDIPVAQFLYPALTSVRVGIAALGERSASLLLHSLGEGPSATGAAPREVLPTALVIRGSCGSRPHPALGKEPVLELLHS